MPFTDFTLSSVAKQFGLRLQRHAFFTPVTPQAPSAWLLESIKRGSPMAFISEKSRSENLISPVLLEVCSFAQGQLAIYSGQRLDIDASRGLTGECDFIISKSASIPVLQAPIISLVEAKRQDIELGYGQTVAQMIASVEFNTREATPMPMIYGCVTTGEVWQFLRLSQEILEIDSMRYYLNELPELLGAFRDIIEQFLELPETRI